MPVARPLPQDQATSVPVRMLIGHRARAAVLPDALDEVRRAIAAIAPHYRDILILCELGDLSYAEAAQVCGIDIGTVRSRLSRARAQLAQRLAPYAADGRDVAKEATQ